MQASLIREKIRPMRYALILLPAVLAVGACNRGKEAASGSGAPEGVKTAALPQTPPAEWTPAEMAGTYVWGCDGKQEREIRLGADGNFKYRLAGPSGAFTTEGQIQREGDQLTLSDKPAHQADRLSHYFLRVHRGRKVLVRADQVASFDLFPSWRQATVRLEPGEKRGAMCRAMRPWPKKNPPAPEKGEVRLPASFTLTFKVGSPGGGEPVTVVVKSAPWWAQAEVCREGCARPEQMPLARPGDWALLNRLWWVQATAPDLCPGKGEPPEPYTLTAQGPTFRGDLAVGLSDDEVPTKPCPARRALVSLIRTRVETMHPPAPPARRPAGGPQRE